MYPTIGAIIGLIVVRAFLLDPMEEIGLRLFFEALGSGRAGLREIQEVWRTATFAKLLVGFLVGGFAGEVFDRTIGARSKARRPSGRADRHATPETREFTAAELEGLKEYYTPEQIQAMQEQRRAAAASQHAAPPPVAARTSPAAAQPAQRSSDPPDGEINEGMTLQEVETRLGAPTRRASAGGRTLYFYPGMKLTFVEGRLASIE